MRRKWVICVSAILVLLLVSSYITVFADAITESEDSMRTGFVDFKTIYEQFEEVTPQEMLDVLQKESIAISGIAGQDVYVQTENGQRLWCSDVDNEVAFYLKFLGYNPVDLGSEPLDPNHKSPISVADAVQMGLTGIVILAFCVVIYRFFTMDKGMNKSAVKRVDNVKNGSSETPMVRFDDVQGIDELKPDLQRLVDCLKFPEKYRAIGARVPKGVILYGPPGTGKTLLAKAIAGEAGVPFFSATGSSFVEKYVGVGARRVRELYTAAKKVAPCIVFIDEIDAVASHRGVGDSQEHDRTINALLAELDGFDKTKNVITIVATNRLELLDDAFKRAGRFDMKLAIGMPDVRARESILRLHSKDKKLSEEVDLKALAKRCVGFSGADLEVLLNESAMNAVGNAHKVIMLRDIDDAFFKVLMHGNKKPRKDVDEINQIVAWHEAGHTLATKLLTTDAVTSVTIAGTASGAGGATFRVPKTEGILTKKYLKSVIQIMYAGRAAESIYGGEESITTGAAADIHEASALLKEYLSAYGMGRNGMLDSSVFGKDTDMLQEAKDLSEKWYQEVVELLSQHLDVLTTLAKTLLENETLTEAEIDKICN